jgi:hypothetical protein
MARLLGGHDKIQGVGEFIPFIDRKAYWDIPWRYTVRHGTSNNYPLKTLWQEKTINL